MRISDELSPYAAAQEPHEVGGVVWRWNNNMLTAAERAELRRKRLQKMAAIAKATGD